MQRRNRPRSIVVLRFTHLAVAVLVLAGFGPAARLAAQCPYSSIQTRVQLNPAMEWRTSLELPQRETFRVGVFANGTGQLASSPATVAVTAPNGTAQNPGIGGYVTASAAGVYTVHGRCGNLSSTISVTVNPAPRYIWSINADVLSAAGWNDFYARLDKIRDAGATATHLSFNWDIVEGTRDAPDWDFAENQVRAALDRGLVPFAYTGATPDWALPSLPQGVPRDRGRLLPAESESTINEFKSFHRDLAARFCGRVRYYQFWNEPNGDGLYTPDDYGNSGFTPDKQTQYGRWLKRWYEAMKEGCEDTVLAPGGFDCNLGTGTGCASQLNQLYAAITAAGNCLNNCFDAFAIHPYGDKDGDGIPALNSNVISEVTSTLAAKGQAYKLLWLDEWAIPRSNMNSGQITAGLDELQGYGNAFLGRYLTLTDADVVRAGLVNDELIPRASYWAFCNHARTNNSFVPAGHWKGRYFQNTTLSGTDWIRDDGDGTLFFAWSTGSPICNFGDSFSARWTRTLDFPAGTYRFTSRTDDGVRVWVDGDLVIDHWENQLPTTVWTGDKTLTAGEHRVKVEYYDQGGNAVAQLSWPMVSTTVCGNSTSSSACNAKAACEWFPCSGGLCLPKFTANPPTCSCAAVTTQTSCNGNPGCSWFACKNKCLAKGTSTYAVCGTGTP